jgi:CelD/BcsL family acetyltransferase involved in cellulose biosynthesis
VNGPAVRVTLCEDPARLDAVRDGWRTVFDAAPEASPFLSWEWLRCWWASFGAGRRLRLLEARDGAGEPCGFLALVGRPGLRPGRRWQLLGNGLGGADGLDALVAGTSAAAARVALLSAALDAGGWDLLDLQDLPCGSPSVRLLLELAGARGLGVHVASRFACPGFALRGTFREHLARIRRRETYGRWVRWLARQPGFRIEVAVPGQARAAIQDFLRLHRLRWKAEGGSYGIPSPAVETFHLAVAQALAERGWLRLYRLFLGDTAIAAVYGLELRRRFFFYQSGSDPAWAVRSPGLVLLGRTIEDAYARGLTDYDFLRGEEAYKLDWTADRRETCAVRLRAPSLRAGADQALETTVRAARHAARAVAPPRLWAALQRMRRRLEAGAGAAPTASRSANHA